MRNCNQKTTGFFALTVGIISSTFKVPNKKNLIANQHVLKVEDTTWAGGAAGAKSTWVWGSKDARVVCVKDVVTTWGFVKYDVALDAAVVKT